MVANATMHGHWTLEKLWARWGGPLHSYLSYRCWSFNWEGIPWPVKHPGGWKVVPAIYVMFFWYSDCRTCMVSTMFLKPSWTFFSVCAPTFCGFYCVSQVRVQYMFPLSKSGSILKLWWRDDFPDFFLGAVVTYGKHQERFGSSGWNCIKSVWESAIIVFRA